MYVNNNECWFNLITRSVHKIVIHFLRILQHFLQSFQSVYDHFVYTKRYRVTKLYFMLLMFTFRKKIIVFKYSILMGFFMHQTKILSDKISIKLVFNFFLHGEHCEGKCSFFIWIVNILKTEPSEPAAVVWTVITVSFSIIVRSREIIQSK